MRLFAIGTLLLAAPSLVAAQSATGTYVVSRGGNEIGREEFTLEPGTRDNRSGSTLTVASTYPGAPRGGRVGTRLGRTADGQFVLFQLDIDGEQGETTVLAAGAGARVILRTVTKESQRGREVPGGENVILLDENVYALYMAAAELATPAGTRLTAIYPRTGRRATVTATREGNAGGAGRIILTGEISGTLTVEAGGRVTAMEFPGAGVSVALADG